MNRLKSLLLKAFGLVIAGPAVSLYVLLHRHYIVNSMIAVLGAPLYVPLVPTLPVGLAMAAAFALSAGTLGLCQQIYAVVKNFNGRFNHSYNLPVVPELSYAAAWGMHVANELVEKADQDYGVQIKTEPFYGKSSNKALCFSGGHMLNCNNSQCKPIVDWAKKIQMQDEKFYDSILKRKPR